MRVLVACFGNVLRGDDGFGVAVAERLQAAPLPEEVRVLDVGIGGIHLVQDLLDPVDALVAVDAMDLGKPAGTVLVVRPDVTDVSGLNVYERRDTLADVHYATPERALMLAGGLGILPPQIVIVGCQLPEAQRLGEALSPEVERGVDVAVGEIRRIVSEFGVPWG